MNGWLDNDSKIPESIDELMLEQPNITERMKLIYILSQVTPVRTKTHYVIKYMELKEVINKYGINSRYDL